MNNGKASKLHILLLVLLLLLLALPARAEEDEPLTLTVEADSECLLSEAGEMTFFRFMVMNTSDEDCILDNVTVQGDVFLDPRPIVDEITIPAHDRIEFYIEKVRIEEFAFDTDLAFQLAWETVSFAPEDEWHEDPIVTEHVVSAAPIRIERFVEPVMTLSFAPDVMLAREGDPVTITYTLTNETKFDMTNITLQDAGIPSRPAIPLERNVLYAEEQMQVVFTFQMGESSLELNPTVRYTVRGVESKTSARETVTVEYVEIDLRMEVEKYQATADGTLFRITLLNNGSHPVTDIRLTDEIGTSIGGAINLEAGSDRTISYTAPAAISSGTVRYISFTATGVDCLGGTVTARSLSAYELLPYVESNQVQLKLSVTMTGASQTDDGSNKLTLLFEIRNDSQVRIRNAVITESDYFMGIVNEYANLSTGSTSFEKEFIVPAGVRYLTFVLTATDPAQTQHAAAPVTLDLSALAQPRATNPPAIKPGKTVDTTGTIYDTERYGRILRMVSLIVLALTMMFLLLSVIFRVAEMNIRRYLPKEPMLRPFGPRRSPAGPAPVREGRDPVHDQFGYMQPAKLRYMERTDRIPVAEPAERAPSIRIQAAPVAATRPMPALAQNPQPIRRKEGDITAVPQRGKPRRPVMMTSDRTMPFAPVHEGRPAAEAPQPQRQEAAPQPQKKQAAPAPAKPETVHPREIVVKPAPRIVPRRKLEIVRVTQP